MKDVWIDLLCLGSAVRTILLSRKTPINRIYYVNRVNLFSSFLIWVLKNTIRRPVEQIASIAEGDENINGFSLYELVQLTVIRVLEEGLSQKKISSRIANYCEKFRYNPIKFREHIRESSYWHILRIVQIQVMSDKLSGINGALYVIRKTPVAEMLSGFLRSNQLYFYSTIISHRLKIQKRPNYQYDSILGRKYYLDRYDCFVETNKWFWFSLFSKIFFNLFHRKKDDQCQMNASKICVELIRSRVRLNEINDIYWLKDSEIDPQMICGIEFEDYDDESQRNLNNADIQRIKIMRNPFKQILNRIRKKNHPYRYIASTEIDLKNTLPYLLRLLSLLFRWDVNSWFLYQEFVYLFNTIKWESIYKQLGARMLWSLHDIDHQKLSKAQAMENLNGLFMGTHWSNFPIDSVETNRCYDVLFTWGAHFIKSNFSKYPHLEVFVTGYPLDFYFKEKKLKAEAIRKEYFGKFILSYHDNVFANDYACSRKMQMQLHQLLISLLNDYDNLVVFLKPKNIYFLEEIFNMLPLLRKYIDDKRIAVFGGDTHRTRAVPAEVGGASDLALGFGISTAATECYFSGTVAFHADLTGFSSNEFANNGLNKVVFRDVESLKKAVQKQIYGEGLSYDDCRKYYEMLDPFQDGKAYIRTGFVVKKLQEAFQMGLSREEAVEKVKKEYDIFLANNFQMVGIKNKEEIKV